MSTIGQGENRCKKCGVLCMNSLSLADHTFFCMGKSTPVKVIPPVSVSKPKPTPAISLPQGGIFPRAKTTPIKKLPFVHWRTKVRMEVQAELARRAGLVL
jgi:hypothetical protein